MKKFGYILTFFIIFCSDVFSQGEIDDQQRLFYRNERTYGGILSSTGYGATFRYAKRINFFNQRVFEGGFNIIRHPKETRVRNPYYPGNRSFVFGKENFFFNLQGGIGFQRIMFKKVDKGGIAVRLIYAGGISLGFYKPVYYEVFVATSSTTYIIVTEKFNPTITEPVDILSRASFFKGFGELKIAPGLYGRFGVNFEFGKKDPRISVLEVGITADVYYKKIPIMASGDNRWIFPAMYVSFSFGKIIDPKSEIKAKYQENQLGSF